MRITSPIRTLGRLFALAGILAGLLLAGRAAPASAAPPTLVTVFPVGPPVAAEGLTVRWEHPGDVNLRGFVVRREAPFAAWDMGTDARSLHDTGLERGRQHRYQVCAVYVGVDIQCSGWVGNTIPVPQPQGAGRPPAPIIYKAEAGETWVRICWNGDAGYDSYFVDYEEKGVRNTIPPIDHENGGPHGCQRIDGLQPARTYVVIVQGCRETWLGIGSDRCYDWSAPYEVSTFTWQLLDDHRETSFIVADGADLYQVRTGGSIWKYTGTPRIGWQALISPRETNQVIASGGNLYVLLHGGGIYKYGGTPGNWQLLDDNTQSEEIVADGVDLYQRRHDKSIWKYTGTPRTGWQPLDSNERGTVSISAGGGSLYQMHQDNSIWKWTGTPFGTPGGWQPIDSNRATDRIRASGGNLYQMHSDGTIWKWTGMAFGTPGAWLLIDANTAAKDIVADGDNLYQIHHNGSIWKYGGAPGRWQFLDGNPAAKWIAASGGNLYQIHENGSIWKYIGR